MAAACKCSLNSLSNTTWTMRQGGRGKAREISATMCSPDETQSMRGGGLRTRGKRGQRSKRHSAWLCSCVAGAVGEPLFCSATETVQARSINDDDN